MGDRPVNRCGSCALTLTQSIPVVEEDSDSPVRYQHRSSGDQLSPTTFITRCFSSMRQGIPWAMFLVALVAATEADNGGWHEGRADPRDGVGHEQCPFLAIDVNKLTIEEFKAKCVGPRVPCIIRNGFTDASRWRREAFLERYGGLNVTVGSRGEFPLNGGFPSDTRGAIPIETLLLSQPPSTRSVFMFLSDLIAVNSPADSLAFQNNVPSLHPSVHSVVFADEDSNVAEVLSLGKTGGGIDYHEHGASFFALVYGWKTWYVYPPGKIPDAVLQQLNPARGNWKNVSWHDAADTERPLRCQQQPGTVLYLPSLYHHATENHGEAIGLAWQLDPPEVSIKSGLGKQLWDSDGDNPFGFIWSMELKEVEYVSQWSRLASMHPLNVRLTSTALDLLCVEWDIEWRKKRAIEIVSTWESQLDALARLDAHDRDQTTLLTLVERVLQWLDEFSFCLVDHPGEETGPAMMRRRERMLAVAERVDPAWVQAYHIRREKGYAWGVPGMVGDEDLLAAFGKDLGPHPLEL
eukprot:Stramenopile-MAST_4_protein_2523